MSTPGGPAQAATVAQASKPLPTSSPADARRYHSVPSHGTLSAWTPADARLRAEQIEASCSPPTDGKKKPKNKNKSIDAWASCKAQSGLSSDATLSGTGGTTMSMMGSTPPDIDGCTGTARAVCAWDEVHHFESLGVTTNAPGELIEVNTSGLTSFLGSVADTVIFLLKCDDVSCASGSIVASDDDGNTATSGGTFDHLDSRLSYVATSPGTYRVIITSYEHGREGTANYEVKVAGVVEHSGTGAVFGGWHVRGKELRSGDQLYVGKNANDPPTAGLQPERYADSVLLVLDNLAVDCDTGTCGDFQMNDDASWGGADVRVSTLGVDGAAGLATRVLVGTWNASTLTPGYVLNGRLIHARRHTSDGGAWTGTDQVDADQDGLPREAEHELGTCDTYTSGGVDVGFVGADCVGVRTMVNGKVTSVLGTTCAGNSGDDPACWSPKDSDNDGLLDLWEVWAGVLACDHAPSLPTNSAGTCEPVDLRGPPGCPAGKHCIADAVSAMSKPDPTVWDLYVQLDHLGCDASSPLCAAQHDLTSDPQMAHPITAAQEDQLIKFWTDEPATCWDGTTNASSCIHPNDRRYRVALHLEPSNTHQVPDDFYGVEIKHDVDETYSYFNREFGGLLRYSQLGIYGLLKHGYQGGQAITGSQHIVVGNRHADAPAVLRIRALDVLSHELGHCLGFEHPHDDREDCDTSTCGLACSYLDTSCGMSCPKACGAWQNPNVPSVMSYAYGPQGMAPKSPNSPPPFATMEGYCDPLSLRFSKGLHADIDESSLNEESTETWQGIQLAQDLKCYDAFGDGAQLSPYGFHIAGSQMCQDPSYSGPYCDGLKCYVNWNSDGFTVAAPLPVSWDLSDNDMNNGGGGLPDGTCNNDLLRDLDEWGEIFALSRTRRRNKDFPAHTESYRIFSAHFNAGQVVNLAAWDQAELPVQVLGGPSIDEAPVYPFAGCVAPADCNAANCIKDTCSDTQPCPIPSQVCDTQTGECSCTLDAGCVSGVCNSEGRCVNSWGQCSCMGAACQSPVTSSCNLGRCVPMDADSPSNMGSEQSPKDSLSLDGVDDSVVLTHTGSQSPLTGVAARGSFGLSLELRFDGFATGETRQVVMWANGGDLRLVVQNVGGFPVLSASIGSSTLATVLSPGLWYRVRWTAHGPNEEHVLDVLNWDVVQGRYQPWQCTKETNFQGTVALTTDVHFGHDGGSNTDFLSGRLDNLQLQNYWGPLKSIPTGCVEAGP